MKGGEYLEYDPITGKAILYHNHTQTTEEVTFSGNLKLRSTGNMFDLKSGTLTFKGNVDVSTTGNYVLDNGNGSNAKIVCNVMENASIKAESPAKDKAVLGIFQNKNGSELNISGGTITQTNAQAYVLKLADDGNTTLKVGIDSLLLVLVVYNSVTDEHVCHLCAGGGESARKRLSDYLSGGHIGGLCGDVAVYSPTLKAFCQQLYLRGLSCAVDTLENYKFWCHKSNLPFLFFSPHGG